MNLVLKHLKFHQVLSSKDQKHIEDLFEFRNRIMHRSMFKHSELNDEKTEDVIKGSGLLTNDSNRSEEVGKEWRK